MELAFSKPQFPHSAGMIPIVCFDEIFHIFKILYFHSHCPQLFTMHSLFIWSPIYDSKSSRIRLGQPHCAQGSELKTKVAQFVQCTKMAHKREQMGKTIGCLNTEKDVPFYRASTWRKSFPFVSHTMAPLVLEVALIWSITLLELHSKAIPYTYQSHHM